MNWSTFDFIFFGVLLVGTCLAFGLAIKKTRNRTYRVAAGVALITTLILVWINGAVGIIGSEDNKANLMYAGVLSIALVGSVISRFRAHGMARTMFMTALAQMVVTVIAVFEGLGSTGSGWPYNLLILNGIFIGMWLTSGWLFLRSEHH